VKRCFLSTVRQMAVLGALLGASACGPRSTEAATPNTPAPQCSGELPGYERAVRPLIEAHCVKCHSAGESAGEDHDFTQFETLHAQRRTVAAVLRSAAMPPPPAPGPMPDERALLVLWASCGAPKN
jgi:uncharacterized membrane protein